MDDISKEIYRFRKKFNIQPNSSSAANSSTTSNPTPDSKPSSLLPPFPSLARLKPPLTSTPVKRSNSASPFNRNHEPNKASHQALPSLPVRSFSNSNSSSNRNSIRLFGSKPSTPIVKPGSVLPSPTQSASSLRLGGPVTSLGDFKRLLQATQRKRSTISAMEILKPRFGLETTI
ncbi:unnamed protein product [Allacma fusca]|uniref:Uncharacterized protein n=1 Tax=Allacma fusca TaxID=39272 RepID=A0A8J2JBP1_9HEXA|nr:unnamed protein product [Allacma fusca]